MVSLNDLDQQIGALESAEEEEAEEDEVVEEKRSVPAVQLQPFF